MPSFAEELVVIRPAVCLVVWKRAHLAQHPVVAPIPCVAENSPRDAHELSKKRCVSMFQTVRDPHPLFRRGVQARCGVHESELVTAVLGLQFEGFVDVIPKPKLFRRPEGPIDLYLARNVHPARLEPAVIAARDRLGMWHVNPDANPLLHDIERVEGA